MSSPGAEASGAAPRPGFRFAAACLLGGLCVALSAIAAHAVEPQHAVRLQSAAGLGLMHAIAVIALLRWPGRAASWLSGTMLAGAWLFVVALMLAVFWPGSTRFAPWGGGLMILSWLSLAGFAMAATLGNRSRAT